MSSRVFKTLKSKNTAFEVEFFPDGYIYFKSTGKNIFGQTKVITYLVKFDDKIKMWKEKDEIKKK